MCAESWKHEWVYHGICSGYPANQPLEYFNAALIAAEKFDYDPLKGIFMNMLSNFCSIVLIRNINEVAYEIKLGLI